MSLREVVQNQDDTLQDNLKDRYLVFSMGSELYGAPLLQVREVIKSPKLCPVPHTVGWFKGIINLRGQIVSVVDLRQHFGLSSRTSQSGFALMVQCGAGGNGSGIIGALVDQLQRVQEFTSDKIDRDPQIQNRIASEHLLGIARNGDELIHLIDLNAILTQQDYRTESEAA